LAPRSNYTARVSAIWENGHESPLSKEVQFNLAALAPEELALDELAPVQASGNWSGYEIEELLAVPALVVAGQHYPRGLNAFVNSELEYDLFGLYDTFMAQVGLDDRSPKEAAAEFIVLADGKELWRSGVIAMATRAQEVKLKVAGVQKLTLKTISAKAPDRRGQIDWIAPKVLRAIR
jgi:alpha-galactosidase